METVVLSSLIVLAVSIIGILTLVKINSLMAETRDLEVEENNSEIDTSACPAFLLVGDGICDDEANTLHCGFDAGDCCLPFIDDQGCKNCICSKDNARHLSISCGNPDWIGDGVCDESLNTYRCSYDLGDCCSASIDVICTDCTCHERATNSTSESQCEHAYLTGDGYCDEITNNEGCFFDGGDCCTVGVVYYYCTTCICHLDDKKHAPTHTLYSMSGAVCGVAYEEGDLHCDDYLNREECNYDHGDCCLPEIIDTSCTQCLCLEDGTRHPTNEALSQAVCPHWLFVDDGYCDDVSNTVECRFDGGDCCHSSIGATWCLECICHQDNTVHEPYKENTWSNY